MGTVVTCTCKSDFQDKVYSKGMRYANQMKKDGHYRCSVCKKEHAVNISKKEEKKEDKKK